MLAALPTDRSFMEWTWAEIEPYYRELEAYSLDAATLESFLVQWSALSDRVGELHTRLRVATTLNTADQEIERRYQTFLETVFPPAEQAEQRLREKLLTSGLQPAGLEKPLRDMQVDAALFREANLPLITAEQELRTQYYKVVGAQSIVWDGAEITLDQLTTVYQEHDRARREQAWRLAAERWLADREAIDALWQKLLGVRLRIAANADCADYRAYVWQAYKRFDYTPDDCLQFQRAIEEVVVPAATQIYERRRQQLGLDALRPWDLDVDPLGLPPLRPFTRVAELEATAATIFQRVDPELGADFQTMRREGLLDLDARANKAPGGYCTYFDVAKRPFIFMRAVGVHDNVQTMLHEGGHAFHAFEISGLPYRMQREVGSEFSEVASMGMELLASPYLAAEQGGFYSAADAARARREHLEGIVLFWPYMAVVDAFQHWAYEHPAEAADPARCDAQWGELWARFMPGVDWQGLEQERITGWHRKLHIHTYPFYYVEYGLAQLGAVQVWANARRDQAAAVAAYRKALSLGNTVPFPRLFATAGARFAFDAETLRAALRVVQETLASLEAA